MRGIGSVGFEPFGDPPRLFGAVAIGSVEQRQPVAVGVALVARGNDRVKAERVGDRAGVEFGRRGRHQQAIPLGAVAGDAGAGARRHITRHPPGGKARGKSRGARRGQVSAQHQADRGGFEPVAAIEAQRIADHQRGERGQQQQAPRCLARCGPQQEQGEGRLAQDGAVEIINRDAEGGSRHGASFPISRSFRPALPSEARSA